MEVLPFSVNEIPVDVELPLPVTVARVSASAVRNDEESNDEDSILPVPEL